MTGPWRLVDGPAGALRLYSTPVASGSRPSSVLVLCHELPRVTGGAVDAGRAFPALADRLSQESGFRVVTGMLRGAGGSEGDFSASGWLEDLAFLVDEEVGPDGQVWMVGFGLGGAFVLRLAAQDQRIRGVASLAGPADLAAWVADPAAVLERCRRSGVISTEGFPADEAGWAADLAALRPLRAAGQLGDRPLLVVHGTEDNEVTTAAARAIVDAASANGRADLRIVPGASHWLRADPRVVATLIGWLERQR